MNKSDRLDRDLTEAVEWLRAIQTWLLETDNDMLLPTGVLDNVPEFIAENLEGWIGVLNDRTT